MLQASPPSGMLPADVAGQLELVVRNELLALRLRRASTMGPKRQEVAALGDGAPLRGRV